jgi:hypothetical protein
MLVNIIHLSASTCVLTTKNDVVFALKEKRTAAYLSGEKFSIEQSFHRESTVLQ